MSHLPSQTNHAFQDIWRQLANYWRALAPAMSRNSTACQHEVKIFSSSAWNILMVWPRARCWLSDTGSVSRWCQEDVRMTQRLAPGDDTGQMTHDRWHTDTMSHHQPLSPLFYFSSDETACVPGAGPGMTRGLFLVLGWHPEYENRCFRQNTEINQPGQMPGPGRGRRLVFILNYSAGKFIGYN